MAALAARRPPADAPPRTTVVTAYPGDELAPAISRDGQWVAFAWARPGETDQLHVRRLDGEASEPLRVAPPGLEHAEPAWSPDGSEIAFLSGFPPDRPGHEILIVPALGGPVRSLGSTSIREHGLDWSPDGRTLVVSDLASGSSNTALYLLDIETGDRLQLTEPPDSHSGDLSPRFSPSGERVAFVRYRVIDHADVYVVSVADRATRQLTFDDRWATDVDWSHDGRDVIFASDRENLPSLWRSSATGDGEPTLLAAGAERVESLSVARSAGGDGRSRLVYREVIDKVDIWRESGPAASTREPAHPLIASILWDAIPVYSPDGGRILYQSGPRGSSDIWIAKADGSNAHQLVFTRDSRGGRWSPDGSLIVYDSTEGVHVVSADGGIPDFIFEGGGAASFTPDGEWILLTSRRSGQGNVWRVRIDGSDPQQITTGGGIRPLTSSAGRYIYYKKNIDIDAPLCRTPIEGGEEEILVEKRIFFLRWTVWDDKLVYIVQHPERNVVEMFDPETRATTELTALTPGGVSTGLDVSPNGEWMLYARPERRSDLLMLEGF